MRTFIAPIGYDTRRVTRPVVDVGLGPNDEVVLVRPATDADTERAVQAVADVEKLLQEIEPAVDCRTEQVSVDSFEETVEACCALLAGVPAERELVVSLGGGARDVLLPLMVAALVHIDRVDVTRFFSDLDGSVRTWPLPNLRAHVPERARETVAAINAADGWVTLTELADATDQSKSTVIRHVNDLEDIGIVEADTSERAKRVRPSFAGRLIAQDTSSGAA